MICSSSTNFNVWPRRIILSLSCVDLTLVKTFVLYLNNRASLHVVAPWAEPEAPRSGSPAKYGHGKSIVSAKTAPLVKSGGSIKQTGERGATYYLREVQWGVSRPKGERQQKAETSWQRGTRD